MTTLTPMNKKYKILFLCTGNSARSIMGEYFMNQPTIGQGKFEAYSAGSNPRGSIHPVTLGVLRDEFKIDARDARSKAIEEVQNTHFDFVITVCDGARETCPVWPGHPIIAHWGLEDPAAFQGSDEEIYQKFRDIAIQLRRRCELLACLPFEKLDRLKLEQETTDIGK
ncbi:MAG: arsenate reductase ArsC [Chthoniobacterales bacterium]